MYFKSLFNIFRYYFLCLLRFCGWLDLIVYGWMIYWNLDDCNFYIDDSILWYDYNLNVEIVDGCNLRVDGGELVILVVFCEKSGF